MPEKVDYADLVLITKTGLLPHIEEFDVARAGRSIGRVRGSGPIEEVSVKTMQGLQAWTGWLNANLNAVWEGQFSK